MDFYLEIPLFLGEKWSGINAPWKVNHSSSGCGGSDSNVICHYVVHRLAGQEVSLLFTLRAQRMQK
jgi:hypothetical protein